MPFTFNDFMHQVVSPIEKGITSPFTQASSDLKKTSSTIRTVLIMLLIKGRGHWMVYLIHLVILY